MSIVKGNAVLLFVDNVAIGCLTGCTFNSQGSPIDVTCKDEDGAPRSLPQKGPWNISFNGNYKTDSTYGLEQLLAARKNQTLLQIKFGADSDVDEGLYVIGAAYLNQLTMDGQLNAVATFSGQLDGDGDWDYATNT